jgi:biopolymer transport protein ExbD
MREIAGSAGAKRKLSPQASINVTPLVDVVLVLLIIFMIVTPLIHSGFDAKLPPPSSAPASTRPAPTNAIVVALTADGVLTVDGAAVEPGELAGRIRALLEKGRPEPVLFAGDRKAGWEPTARILDAIVRSRPEKRVGIGIVFPAEG